MGKLIVIFLVASIFAFIGPCDGKKGDIEKEWKQFKAEFNKTYESNTEDQKRYKIFKANLKNIQKHNNRFEKGKETYLQEINRFGDLTDKEFGDLYGLMDFSDEDIVHYNDELIRNRSTSTNGTKDHLDWREAGAVTPAKDQGKCGACWIFSAIGAVESYNYRKSGKLLSLSEQSVVDCYSNDTCDGGIPYGAAEFVQNHGIYLERDYPYTGGQDSCRNISKPLIHLDFNFTQYVYNSDEELKESIKKHGPVSVCLYVTAKWRFYSSGVWYHNKCSSFSNHCVLVVGYGTENNNDYWLIKNSWGTNWGQDGFIKVARNIHENYCGITSYGMYLEENHEEDTNSQKSGI